MTDTASKQRPKRTGFSPKDFVLNCSTLLTELPVNERASAAASAGFTEVEFWWPFDGNPTPTNQEIDGFISSLEDAGVDLVGLNFWAGNMAAGDRGRVSTQGEFAAFKDNCAVVAEIGQRTGCKAFNALYGLREPEYSPEEQDELAVKNLTVAAEAVAGIDGTILVEPVSGADEYPLKTAADAINVIERVRAEGAETSSAQNIALLADFYHMAVNGDDVARIVENHVDTFGHIQIADNPGRGAPGTGELPLFEWISRARELGYTGKVALEYKQDKTTAFDWLTAAN